jgi:hypothetical protein
MHGITPDKEFRAKYIADKDLIGNTKISGGCQTIYPVLFPA